MQYSEWMPMQNFSGCASKTPFPHTHVCSSEDDAFMHQAATTEVGVKVPLGIEAQ